MERLLNVMIENRTRICRTLKIDENSGCDEQGHSYPEVLEFRLNEKDAAIRRWLDVVRDRDQWLARIAAALGHPEFVVFKADGVTIKHGELIGLAQRTNEALKRARLGRLVGP